MRIDVETLRMRISRLERMVAETVVPENAPEEAKRILRTIVKRTRMSEHRVSFGPRQIGQQLVARIPWGHNLVIISKGRSIGAFEGLKN